MFPFIKMLLAATIQLISKQRLSAYSAFPFLSFHLLLLDKVFYILLFAFLVAGRVVQRDELFPTYGTYLFFLMRFMPYMSFTGRTVFGSIV